MSEKENNGRFDPDAHLIDDDEMEDLRTVKPERVEYIKPDKEEHIEDITEKYNDKNDDEFEIKNAYDTADDISVARSNSIKKIFWVLGLFALMVLILSWFFKAVKEIDKEEMRAQAKSVNTPQDLNMTTDSVMWQTAKDAEIKRLQDQLNNLSVNPDQNITSKGAVPNVKSEIGLTKDEIVAIIARELAQNPNVTKKTNATLQVKMPKNLKNIIKKGDGSSENTISVDDFLTVKSNEKKPVPNSINNNQFTPASVINTSNSGSSNTVQIPSIDTTKNNNINVVSVAQRNIPNIVDVADLRTNYNVKSAADTKVAKEPKKYYLSSGVAKATLYTGFMAQTLVAGEKQQQPVYLSIDSPILAANDATIDLQECTVMGTSKGNLNSGRAEIRLSELNCMLRYKNGKTTHITEKVEGWVYGEDGVYGLKGRLVSSEGKILKSALPMALIQALIGSLSQLGQAPTSISTVGTTSMINPQNIQSGALRGVAKSTNQSLSQIIDYYMEMLKELNPAIEILGGRNGLSILFKGGEELKEKDYTQINISKIGKGRE